MKLADIPFEIWMGILITSGYLLSSQILLNILSKFDPDLFNALGSPHIIWNSTPRNNYLFSKWIIDILADNYSIAFNGFFIMDVIYGVYFHEPISLMILITNIMRLLSKR